MRSRIRVERSQRYVCYTACLFRVDIANEGLQEWLKMGGKFTMSDDSHGIAQVATNYGRAVEYLIALGVEDVWTLRRVPHPGVDGDARARLEEVKVPLQVFREQFKSG